MASGQFVQLRVTSGSGYLTPSAATLTVGTYATRWVVTTFAPVTNAQLVVSCTPAVNNGTPPRRQRAALTWRASVPVGGMAPHQYQFLLHEPAVG